MSRNLFLLAVVIIFPVASLSTESKIEVRHEEPLPICRVQRGAEGLISAEAELARLSTRLV